MHMVFARICQNSIDFEATFFHQNWVIKRVRNSILHWKLQVILTVLFSNPQNARAVSHLPGCLWSRYIYHQSNWGLLIGGVDGSIKIQLVFGCISIFDNDPKSYSYWKLSYSIAIVRGPPYSQIVWAFAWGFKSGSQIPSNAKFAHDTHVFGLGCAWWMNVDETFALHLSFTSSMIP